MRGTCLNHTVEWRDVQGNTLQLHVCDNNLRSHLSLCECVSSSVSDDRYVYCVVRATRLAFRFAAPTPAPSPAPTVLFSSP
jgi:hypothetical protein